jgi:site-specific recombinase XerC
MERWQSTVVGEPLAAFRCGFAGWLEGRGYASGSILGLVRLMASLARWMEGRIGAGELTAAAVADFVAWRRSAGYSCWRSPAALVPLVAYLASVGVLADDEPAAPSDQVDALVDGFAGWLVGEHGAGEGAVKRNLVWARAFAGEVLRGGGDVCRRPDAGGVEKFIAAVARRLKPSSMGAPVSAVRQFLRYLASVGVCDVALADAVPSVRRTRRLGLPAMVGAESVKSAVAGCAGRGTAAGWRAAAVTALAADLGLRGAEIARLALDDIDWAHAVVVVAGKNGLREEMPLTERAGQAVADWLRFGRRPLGTRHVFHTVRAPLRPMTASAVVWDVRRAGQRAGLDGFGLRAVRHSLGCAVVAGEGTLEDAGQLLRHLSSSATAIYARVDVAALRELAAPWPGAAS